MSRTGALAACLLTLVIFQVSPPASAHTEVLRAEPAPGEEVTAPVDEVELTFLDPILPDPEIAVVDDDTRPVAGLGTVETSDDGTTASVGFDPLSGPGGYVVEYTFTALDGDTQRETYRFTVVAPLTTPADVRTPDENNAARLAGPVVVAATLAGGLVVALRRRRSAREPAARGSGTDVTEHR